MEKFSFFLFIIVFGVKVVKLVASPTAQIWEIFVDLN